MSSESRDKAQTQERERNRKKMKMKTKMLGILPVGLLGLVATSLSPVSVLAQSSGRNKTLNVPFPDAPADADNVVKDNFLGISWELFVMNYLCQYFLLFLLVLNLY